jgi:hypothetical protein
MIDFGNLPLNLNKAIGSVKGSAEQVIPTTIEQTERLFTARSRNINHQTGGGDRGQHTFVQLLTQKKGNLVSSHGGEGKSPTSLGTDSKGALADAVNGKYGEFLLTDIRVSLDEKLQISETFGDAEIVYYFGRQPINVQFQGLLIDSPDNNWFIQFVEMYAHVMRGSELARNYELLKIITPNMTFVGTMSHLDWSQNSQRDTDIPFGFNMLVKQIIPNAVMVPGKPMESASAINSDKVESFRTQSDIYSMKTKANTILNTVQNPYSTLGDLSSSLSMNTVLSNSTGGTPNYLGSISQFEGLNTAGGAAGSSTTLSSLSTGTAPAVSSTTSSAGIFSNVSSTLAGVRASLFSPVYGVLSSLTKLIKNVTGSINSVINSFTNPVRDMLRDIRNISNQAMGVVNLINNSIDSFTNNIRRTDSDLRATLATLKKTAGVISHAPQTITSHLRGLVNSGKLPATVGYLRNGGSTTVISKGNRPASKIFLLNSGPKHTPEQGAKL